MSGMNAARELRRRGSNAVIFFITSLTHYAIEGYEVHAFSFLAKPLRYEVFAERMGDALRMMKKSVGQVLQFQTAEGLIRVNTNEIGYIESFRHEIKFVCDGFSFTAGDVTLSVLEQQLAGCGFFRVHKSYLINMRNIRLIGETEIHMVDGGVVPLSKYRRREFLSVYAVYRKERL
ncbi:MAG: response regulator transcription factor [Faecalibacterium sp.]|nr:response regulator transcription factor [Faecalibacterium sp.]